jgi:hypothetical protein
MLLITSSVGVGVFKNFIIRGSFLEQFIIDEIVTCGIQVSPIKGKPY